MQIPFELDERAGHIDLAVTANDDPAAVGCPPWARGFPCCLATVHHPAQGYAGALGWIQVVRSTDGRTAGDSFEMDPFDPLGDVPHPFCFFGFLPTLFDAPSRSEPDDLAWLAHAFLCRIDEAENLPLVVPVVGFGWGFSRAGGQISILPPLVLAASDWDSHRPLLGDAHPDWAFADSVRA